MHWYVLELPGNGQARKYEANLSLAIQEGNVDNLNTW